MDLQYANQSSSDAFTKGMQNLKTLDDQQRQYLADRASNMQDRTASGFPTANTDLPPASSAGLDASPTSDATSGSGASAPAEPTSGRQTLAGPGDPVNGVPAQPATPTWGGRSGGAQGDQEVKPPNPNGAWAGSTAQPADKWNAKVAAEQAVYDKLKSSPRVGSAALAASAKRLAALRSDQSASVRGQADKNAANNPSVVGPEATASAPSQPAAGNSDVTRLQGDLEGIQREIARANKSPDSKAKADQLLILNSEMKNIQARLAAAGGASTSGTSQTAQTPQAASVPQGAAPQQAAAPQPAPVTPQGPGQTFDGTQGADYNFDSDAAHLQLLQLQQQYKLLQFKANNAATPQERDQAFAQLQQVQSTGQQVHQQIFSNNMLQATRAVENGNMGALGQMVQSMAQNTQTPLVIHTVGNGQYALYTPQGQMVAQPGTPVDLAHMLYAKVAPAGRDLTMKNAMAYNQAFQAAAAEANAKAGPAERLKNMEIQGEISKALVSSNMELMKATLEQHGLKAVSDPMGTGMYVYSPDRSTMMFIPTNAGGKPQVGLDFKSIPKQGIPQ
jgi:hypothetical protein